jgi:hypothetical protein
MIVSARDFSGNLERKESSMARKSLVAVVLAAGLMALGCGEKKTAMLTPSPAMVATATGSVSPGIDGLASAFELGNAYQMLASVGYASVDYGSITESDINVGFTYYLKAVDNNDKPIGLQEFLAPVSQVDAAATMVSGDAPIEDDTVWQVGGDYGFMSNKLFAVADVRGQKDVFGWDVGAQYYILPALAAKATFGMATDSSGPTDVNETDINIGAEYAVELGGRWLDLGLDVLLASWDVAGDPQQTTINFMATYYLLKELGISVGYMSVAGDITVQEGSGIGFGAKYYYGPMAFGVNYLMFTPDASGADDITRLGIEVEYRF